jgi:hypothetical protein
MATDKNTIGVTKQNEELLEDLVERGLFNDQMDAAKLALSLAVRSAVGPGEASGVDTKWNVGSFDKEGHVPYRLAEYLINQGLVLLATHLATNPDLDIATLQVSLSAKK